MDTSFLNYRDLYEELKPAFDEMVILVARQIETISNLTKTNDTQAAEIDRLKAENDMLRSKLDVAMMPKFQTRGLIYSPIHGDERAALLDPMLDGQLRVPREI